MMSWQPSGSGFVRASRLRRAFSLTSPVKRGPAPGGPAPAAAASTRPTPASRPPATAALRPPSRQPGSTGRPPAASAELESPFASCSVSRARHECNLCCTFMASRITV
ncbi:hypothetical protein SEVIR_5G241401v4 [Setaria viridis]